MRTTNCCRDFWRWRSEGRRNALSYTLLCVHGKNTNEAMNVSNKNRMSKSLITLGMVALAVAAASLGVVRGQADAGKKHDVVFLSTAQATFKEAVPGVSKAVVWGDPDQGAYGAFTKFKPGQDNGMHTHTNDTWIVGIKGAYLYKDDAGEKRVGPGDFIRIPGGHKHWSGGDKTEGALFYEEGSGKFDLLPAK